MKPPISILDPRFKYTSSAKTDLKKTFRRLEREAKERAEKIEAEKASKVSPIRGKAK